MPWEQVSIMERRKEFVALAGQDAANKSNLCRRFGISRTTGYKWLSRASAEPASLADRSRRPLSSPGRTPPEMEDAILSVRAAHPAWGARKIARCLERDGLSSPAPSTIHAVLCRHGLVVRSRGSDRATSRFEKPGPNQLWQMDFKGRVKLANGHWVHPLTILDDHARYALCLEACRNEQTQTVKPLMEETFRTYGLPDALYVDNGNPWGNGGQGRWTRLAVWLMKLGIDVIHSRPYHPQGRGKNERFHRTLNAEVFALKRFYDFGHVQRAFDVWRTLYNTERPHQALDMDVPASRYRPSPRSFPERLPDIIYGPGEILRRVGTTNPYVSFKGRLWLVGRAFQGETVAIRPRAIDGQFAVYFASTHITDIDLKA